MFLGCTGSLRGYQRPILKEMSMLRNLLRNVVPMCALGWVIVAAGPAMSDEPHPLQAAIDFCESAHREVVRQITDYEALLVKRERVKGRLGDPEVLAVKIRHARNGEEEMKTPWVCLRLAPEALSAASTGCTP